MRTSLRPFVVILPIVAFLIFSAEAASQSAPVACGAAEHRQFDFWIGEWSVSNPDGTPAGRSSVTRELDGCVIQEHWWGAGQPAFEGRSFNLFEAASKTWRQSWVDNSSRRLALLQGAFRDGRMILEGEADSPQGHHKTRITWSVIDEGIVRQHVEFLFDGAGAWRTVFDGRYKRSERK